MGVYPLRAMVTGDAGFIGRHMRTALEQRGWDVSGCDLKTGDDCRREVFRRDDTVYDLVVHCAYHVGGRAAIDGEPRNLARNLELDATMFEWAVQTGQRRVLYFSSSAAYPVRLQTSEWVAAHGIHHLAEDDINLHQWAKTGDWTPDARYGWAKLTGEQMAEAARIAGIRVHVVRPFSGYGGDQDITYPFPAILRRVLTGELSVWGPPGQYRDWVHVDDVIGCSLAIVDQDVDGPVNICTGAGVEMGDLAIRMARIAGVAVPAEVTYLQDQPTGVMARVGSPDRMAEIYRPTVDLDEGIRRAVRARLDEGIRRAVRARVARDMC
jgi:nucleoside-diphosphate-sugar epimerase